MSFQCLPLRPSSLARPAVRLSLAALKWIGVGGLLATATLTPASTTARGAEAPLTLVERSIIQDQGSWLVDYRLRYDGAAGMIVPSNEIHAKVEGWVSNSRVASHALPRWSSLIVSGPSGLATATEVIAAGDESQRCHERMALQVWTGDAEPPPEPFANAKTGTGTRGSGPGAGTGTGTGTTAAERPTILSLAPGATVRVRLRIEHQHFLYGDYDPLLGLRTVEIRLGGAVLDDPVVPMDREQYLAHPKTTWPVPPEDRRDTRHYVSGPDSLHLEAHIPGNQYYRFPERAVRYGTKMRLRFWYLIAAGTEGECRARVAQYKDTPTAWKVLTDGAHEDTLATVGRWVKVERIFRTQSEATTLALDFRICGGAEVGEMWIDDVSLEPVGVVPSAP
jgi:hypothetical protein